MILKYISEDTFKVENEFEYDDFMVELSEKISTLITEPKINLYHKVYIK